MYEERKQPAGRRPELRTIAILGLECAALIAAAVGVGFIVGGCGEKADPRMTSNGSANPSTDGGGAMVAMAPSPTAVPLEEGADVASADSLPPDVAASVTDTLVVPGAAVEITAQASPDALDLWLWDGIGKPQPFAYDQAGKVWRAFYRVPIKAGDRLGLSVTAKNAGGRWRRVWVFLTPERGGGNPQPSPPSEP
jgi:hypothetical protein